MKRFKKTAFTFFTLLTIFTFITCKKDFIDSPSDNIIGNWNEVSYFQPNDVASIKSQWVTVSGNNAINYQFKADSTFTVSNYSYYKNCTPIKFTYNKNSSGVLITKYDCSDRNPTSLDTLRIRKLTTDSLLVDVTVGWFGGYSIKFVRSN